MKTNWDKKLENKFFGSFWVLHTAERQPYKLELPTKWKIYDVFHESLLEQNTTKKEWVGNVLLEPKKNLEFEVGGNKEYKVKAIINSALYN